MPKHKKTREEKIKSDLRNVSTLQNSNGIYSFSNYSHANPNLNVNQEIGKSTLALVKKDLLKTAIVSAFILFLQVVFFTILKSHLLAISFVRY